MSFQCHCVNHKCGLVLRSLPIWFGSESFCRRIVILFLMDSTPATLDISLNLQYVSPAVFLGSEVTVHCKSCLAALRQPLGLFLSSSYSYSLKLALAVNTPTELPLSLPVLSSQRQSTTKYTHQAAQKREPREKHGSKKTVFVSPVFMSATLHVWVWMCTCVGGSNFHLWALLSKRRVSFFHALFQCNKLRVGCQFTDTLEG